MDKNHIDFLDFFLKKKKKYSLFNKRLEQAGVDRDFLSMLPPDGYIILAFPFPDKEKAMWNKLNKEWGKSLINK